MTVDASARPSRRIIPAVHRFFAPALDSGDETVTLPRDEGEHLTRVLRLGAGDTVAVFDGRGHEFLARVASAVRRDVRVQILSRVDPAAESAVALTLAQAVLKGEKMDDVVRDAVMLGVAAIQPIVTKRSETTVAGAAEGRAAGALAARGAGVGEAVAPRGPARDPGAADARDRARRAGRRAADDAGRADARRRSVEPMSVLQGAPAPADATRLCRTRRRLDGEEEWPRPRRTACGSMSLGPRTLRADAVPIAAISVLQFVWGEL